LIPVRKAAENALEEFFSIVVCAVERRYGISDAVDDPAWNETEPPKANWKAKMHKRVRTASVMSV
jgi:hypothetical protein